MSSTARERLFLCVCKKIQPAAHMPGCRTRNRTTRFFLWPFALLIVGLIFPRCRVSVAEHAGQAPARAGASTEDLQKATQNPVASLISVPVQNNSNFVIGPFDRNQNVLNIPLFRFT